MYAINRQPYLKKYIKSEKLICWIIYSTKIWQIGWFSATIKVHVCTWGNVLLLHCHTANLFRIEERVYLILFLQHDYTINICIVHTLPIVTLQWSLLPSEVSLRELVKNAVMVKVSITCPGCLTQVLHHNGKYISIRLIHLTGSFSTFE